MRTRHGLLLAAVLGLLSCQAGGENEEDFKGDLVSESDSIICGGQDEVYTNLTDFNRDVHIRLKNNCHIPPNESLIVGFATLRVLDEAGQVVNRQQVLVGAGSTRRTTVSVPGKGRIEIKCGNGDRETGYCPWAYSYSP